MPHVYLLTVICLALPFTAFAQVQLPPSGCSIRYDHDPAGNRTSRYWYCWGNTTFGGETTSGDDDPGDDDGDGKSMLAEMALGLYPNPASDELTIALSHPVDNAHFSIHDLHGRVVQQGLFQGERMTVAITGLAPGPYHMRLMRKDEMFVKQFIVE